jgi:hypothetical protein
MSPNSGSSTAAHVYEIALLDLRLCDPRRRFIIGHFLLKELERGGGSVRKHAPLKTVLYATHQGTPTGNSPRFSILAS